MEHQQHRLVESVLSRAERIADEVTLRDIINRVVASGPHDEPIHVLELDQIVHRYTEWVRCLPRVKQYYAIKSNDADVIVETIVLLGGGFDCASQSELERVLGLGVSAGRIIFAQPSKSVASLELAHAKRIRTVFDNEFELEKIAKHHPEAEVLLRFRYDSTNSKINLGSKFGCNVTGEAEALLDRARQLRINVVGWCFNVGSMSYDAEVFYDAIRAGRTITDYATSIGFQFRVLDIGGGYVGDKDDDIARYACPVNRALDEFFPGDSWEIFAEPGRYLCAAAVTNITTVQGKRYVRSGATIDSVGYYLNDGIYGTFYGAKYRGMVPKIVPWKDAGDCGPERETKLYGPTCDGNDWFMANFRMPEMDVGDTLVFETEGAYCSVHSCRFNGFHLPKIVPYVRQCVAELLQRISSCGQDCDSVNQVLLSTTYRTQIGHCFEPVSFTNK